MNIHKLLKNSKDHLCRYCDYCYPECTCGNIQYGNGPTNDNIVMCQGFKRNVQKKIDKISLPSSEKLMLF